jgi:hypothetical protein
VFVYYGGDKYLHEGVLRLTDVSSAVPSLSSDLNSHDLPGHRRMVAVVIRRCEVVDRTGLGKELLVVGDAALLDTGVCEGVRQ